MNKIKRIQSIAGGALLGIGVATSPFIGTTEALADEYQEEIERVIKSGEIKDCSDEESPIDKLICEENNKLVIGTQNIARKKQEIARKKQEIARINEDTARIDEDTARINEDTARIDEKIAQIASIALSKM